MDRNSSRPEPVSGTGAPDRSSRQAWVWLVGVLAGVAAFSLWLALGPTSGPAWKTRILVCLVIGLLVCVATIEAGQQALHAGKARCPVCGYVGELNDRGDAPFRRPLDKTDGCPACVSGYETSAQPSRPQHD